MRQKFVDENSRDKSSWTKIPGTKVPATKCPITDHFTPQRCEVSYLCTFMGFSSSSSRALQRVRSLISSRCVWCTSLLSSSTLATVWWSSPFSRLRFRTSAIRMRMSSTRARYWTSPLDRVLVWILIFSYRSASSSLRRIS